MGGVTITLKRVQDSDYLMFEYPPKQYRENLNKVLQKCKENTSDYVTITINRPYKPRTTGEGSQNNLLWKLITIIANEVGDDSQGMIDTENGVKMRALSKGYPFRINKLTGEKIPESMKNINTVECSYLIEMAQQICAELGIVLPSDCVIQPQEQDVNKLVNDIL